LLFYLKYQLNKNGIQSSVSMWNTKNVKKVSFETFLPQLRKWSLTPPPTGVGEDAGKKEPSYTVGGDVN
jgi:hypothetical protein